MTFHGFEISEEKIASFCRENKISEFAVFGSILTGDFRPSSDIDILVTFDANCGYSLFELAMIQEKLQNILGRKVDLVEKAALKNPFRKKDILDHMEVIYAA
ncbi:MAG: nucleotidyltransferase family protein [Planctomycetes bacterium]|nr:nucleotidyltransferase family protein [Planctomycetota bacterium]